MRFVSVLLALLVAAPVWAQAERDVVARAKADLVSRGVDLSGECGAWQITRLAAWRLRETGAGLLEKRTGAQCQGFAVDVIAFPDGRTFDVLIDGGQTNGPDWRQHLPHDPAVASRWRPAPESGDAGSASGGGSVPPAQTVDLSGVYSRLESIRAEQESLYAQIERVYSDLQKKADRNYAQLLDTDKRLEAHDNQPGWLKKLLTNANTYAVIAGVVGGWVMKEQAAK
jgi:hypothetical protein